MGGKIVCIGSLLSLLAVKGFIIPVPAISSHRAVRSCSVCSNSITSSDLQRRNTRCTPQLLRMTAQQDEKRPGKVRRVVGSVVGGVTTLFKRVFLGYSAEEEAEERAYQELMFGPKKTSPVPAPFQTDMTEVKTVDLPAMPTMDANELLGDFTVIQNKKSPEITAKKAQTNVAKNVPLAPKKPLGAAPIREKPVEVAVQSEKIVENTEKVVDEPIVMPPDSVMMASLRLRMMQAKKNALFAAIEQEKEIENANKPEEVSPFIPRKKPVSDDDNRNNNSKKSGGGPAIAGSTATAMLDFPEKPKKSLEKVPENPEKVPENPVSGESSGDVIPPTSSGTSVPPASKLASPAEVERLRRMFGPGSPSSDDKPNKRPQK